MVSRLVTILVLIAGLTLASAASADVALDPVPSLAGFELLASVGYGGVTEDYRLKTEPYGAMFSLDLGYRWKTGLRLDAHATYGLGQSIAQTYERVVGREVELTSKAQSFTAALSVGYDLWIRFLLLRYSVKLGVTWMGWDLGDLHYSSLGGYSPMKGSALGFAWAPGLALLWPVQRFEYGIGFDYLLQTATHIPSAIMGQAIVGMKL
jgi:hypothetical protein